MASPSARMDFDAFAGLAPKAVAALEALDASVARAGLDPALVELVKIRVSQVNGCAFCLRLHVAWARAAGVPDGKIDTVATWREAGTFTPRETAALAWAEALTLLPAEGAPDATYAALREHFDEAESAFLTIAVGTINQWNRIAVGLRFSLPAADRLIADEA